MRLRPFTLQTPKPLLPVGELPIINYLVDMFFRNGIVDVRIGIQLKHLGSFRHWKNRYYSAKNIDFDVEESPSGTFTPIFKLGTGWFDGPIVVSNGDELKDIDLANMVKWHFKQHSPATIGLIKVENPCDYGVASLKGHKIISFAEKPACPPSPYINSGIYVLNPEVKNYYPLGAGFAMMEKELFPKLAQERKLYGYKLSGQWMDTGTIQKWKTASSMWNNRVPSNIA